MSIAPVGVVFSATGNYNQVLRQWLPLSLYWPVVMLKSQGKTVEKVVIDLETSDANVGQAIMGPSPAERQVDLLVEHIPCDRLSTLGEKPTEMLRRHKSCCLHHLLDNGE